MARLMAAVEVQYMEIQTWGAIFTGVISEAITCEAG